MVSDLIYDVGLHDGEDTAYYLSLGHRVVAIDANPSKIEMAKEKFAAHIKAGKLVLVNVGIFPVAGEFDFWVSEFDFWSSFDQSMASRFSRACVPVRVRCRPFQEILREFGVPHFLKIDVEGQEDQCLKGLSPDELPRYVSWEASLESLAQLYWMHKLGYNAFKCIDQKTLTASLKKRIASDRVTVRARNRILRIFTTGADTPVKRHTGWEFQAGSSGPFGEETDGKWQSFESLADDWIAYCRKAIRATPDKLNCWFDFHATIK